MKTISVIIPAYNRANLIGETLRSLLNQTVLAKEIIVVDDGSTDPTVEVVESEFSVFRQRFSGNPELNIPTLKIIRQSNAGPGAARNRGFAESTGEFIHFFDSDDIAAPNKHEVQLKALLETGADIAYGPWVKGRFLPKCEMRNGEGELTTEHTEGTEHRFVQKQDRAWSGQSGDACSNPSAGEPARYCENTSPTRFASCPASAKVPDSGSWSFQPDGPVLQARGLPKGNLIKALLTNWSVVPHACLFRRSIVEAVGGFPQDLFGTEDQLMFLRCLLAGAKVVHSPRTMEFYRVGDPSKITATGAAQKRHAKEWARFLLKANWEVASGETTGAWGCAGKPAKGSPKGESRGSDRGNRVASESRRVPAVGRKCGVEEILTTEDTESAERQKAETLKSEKLKLSTAEKADLRPGSRAGAEFSNPSTSELARDCENTSLNRTTIGLASAEALDAGRWSLDSTSAWFGFRLRAYEAWRDLRAFFPKECLDLEDGLEKIWKKNRFSAFSFQFSGFLIRIWGGLKQRVVGHRCSRVFRTESYNRSN